MKTTDEMVIAYVRLHKEIYGHLPHVADARRLIDAALAASPLPPVEREMRTQVKAFGPNSSALHWLSMLNADAPESRTEPFPKPSKNIDGKPCGECHIKPGETCDICGAANPQPRPDAGPKIGCGPWAKTTVTDAIAAIDRAFDRVDAPATDPMFARTVVARPVFHHELSQPRTDAAHRALLLWMAKREYGKMDLVSPAYELSQLMIAAEREGQ